MLLEICAPTSFLAPFTKPAAGSIVKPVDSHDRSSVRIKSRIHSLTLLTCPILDRADGSSSMADAMVDRPEPRHEKRTRIPRRLSPFSPHSRSLQVRTRPLIPLPSSYQLTMPLCPGDTTNHPQQHNSAMCRRLIRAPTSLRRPPTSAPPSSPPMTRSSPASQT